MGRPENSRVTSASRPIRAATFDVTHTLIHSPRLAEIYWQVLRRHGHAVGLRDVRREIPRVWQEFSCRVDHRIDRFTAHPRGARGYWQEFLVRLCQCLGTEEPSRFAGAELFGQFARAESWEVYPDVRKTLRNLRSAGIRLGVVSNWDHRLPQLLQELDLNPYFEAIVWSEDCGLEKPHPQIFHRCLEELGVSPEECLHVGDHAIDDVEGAQGAGLRALRIDREKGCGGLGKLFESLLKGPQVPSEEGLTTHDGGRHVRR